MHYRNILDTGLGMADPRLARILAHESVERTEELERWGMRFVPDPQEKRRHYAGYSCFGDQPRAHAIANSGFGHAGDVVRVLVHRFSITKYGWNPRQLDPLMSDVENRWTRTGPQPCPEASRSDCVWQGNSR